MEVAILEIDGEEVLSNTPTTILTYKELFEMDSIRILDDTAQPSNASH